MQKYRRQRSDWGNLDLDWPGGSGSARAPSLHTGGGASGEFSGAADAAGGVGDVVGGALEAAGSADEAAVVVVPVAYASARVAVRVVREGWLSAALRLPWKPLLGAVVCAVILGATIDHFVPDAHSLPQAIRLVRAPAR